jgi:hypothetical protein
LIGRNGKQILIFFHFVKKNSNGIEDEASFVRKDDLTKETKNTHLVKEIKTNTNVYSLV